MTSTSLAPMKFPTATGELTVKVDGKDSGAGYKVTVSGAPGQKPVTFHVNNLEQLHAKLKAQGVTGGLEQAKLPGPAVTLGVSTSSAGKTEAKKAPEPTQQQTIAACEHLGIKIPKTMTPEFKAQVKAAVIAYQKELFAQGYDVGPKGADGIFGSDTLKATNAFEKDGGFPTLVLKELVPSSGLQYSSGPGDAVSWNDANGPKPKVYADYEGARAALVKKHDAAKSPAEKDKITDQIAELDSAAKTYQALSQTVPGAEVAEKALKGKISEANAKPAAVAAKPAPDGATLAKSAYMGSSATTVFVDFGDKGGAKAYQFKDDKAAQEFMKTVNDKKPSRKECDAAAAAKANVVDHTPAATAKAKSAAQVPLGGSMVQVDYGDGKYEVYSFASADKAAAFAGTAAGRTPEQNKKMSTSAFVGL